ncbi:MAG: ABC transporter transmembrane domain-containing protein, partial [Promethearchaeota archaeon]
MKNNKTISLQKTIVEFSPGKDPFEKARQKGTRSWILAHLFHGSNKFLVLIVLITNLLTSNIWSITAIFVGRIINDIAMGISSNLLNYIFIYLILHLSSPILRIINSVLREMIAQRMERDCRREFYTNLLGKSQSFHEQQQIGDLMARVTNDVRMLNFLISPSLSLIFESFTALVIPIVYIIIFFPFQLILAPLIFTIFFILSLRSYIKKLQPVTFRLRANFAGMVAKLNETLTGIEVVKSSVQEMNELKKYLSNVQEYRNAFVDQGKVQAKYLPFLILALTITIGLTHGITLNFIFPTFLIGNLIGYLGLFSQLRFPTQISIFVFSTIRIAITSSERLISIMNNETEIDENIQGIEKTIEGKISFENVSFSYPNSDKS